MTELQEMGSFRALGPNPQRTKTEIDFWCKTAIDFQQNLKDVSNYDVILLRP